MSQAQCVADLVRRQLPVALQDRPLDLIKERRRLAGALRRVTVRLDQPQAHQSVLPTVITSYQSNIPSRFEAHV